MICLVGHLLAQGGSDAHATFLPHKNNYFVIQITEYKAVIRPLCSIFDHTLNRRNQPTAEKSAFVFSFLNSGTPKEMTTQAMPAKKKTLKASDDKTWSVVSFNNNAVCQQSGQVSIQTISEEGLCDDVLSNTSSDESELPVNPLRASAVTEYGYDTLVVQGDEPSGLQGLSPTEDQRSRFLPVFSPLTDNRVTRALSGLHAWQIVLLTSSTTLFLSYLIQTALQNPLASSVESPSTTPYFTNHGATYRDVDFVLPFGDITGGSSKYIVDFENRVAYPIVPDVSLWESAKVEATQIALTLHSSICNFRSGMIQTFADRFESANSSILRKWTNRKAPIFSRLHSGLERCKTFTSSVNAMYRPHINNAFRSVNKKCRVSFGRYLTSAQGSFSLCASDIKSVVQRVKHMVPEIKTVWLGTLDATNRFKGKTSHIVIDKWNNTMKMLRFKGSGTQD
ncbi:LADA_0G04148g1_1 [Lachancea dasiensis]|uniref:LADA_0G04148g1_1 n=1 Tax=Lachancea dasiensis TaxID=1072105 RepID=A0A1G4JS19_9SACH|nr:LADA_0G04148g1_1 [Lachancea dasiensis]